MAINDSSWISIAYTEQFIFYNTGKAWGTDVIDQFLITNNSIVGNPELAMTPWLDYHSSPKQGLATGPVMRQNVAGFNKPTTNVWFYRPDATGQPSPYFAGRIIRKWSYL